MNDHALHMFDPVVAEEVGVVAAIVYFNIEFWCKFNEQTGKNFRAGSWWTYKPIAGLARDLPYLSEKQIRYALDKLIESDYIKQGNFNKKGYDKTKWYAVNEAKTGTFVGKTGTFVGKTGTFVGKTGNFVGKNCNFVGKNCNFVTPYDKSAGTYVNFVRTSDNFVKPIPDKTTDKTTDITIGKEKVKRETFSPPTLEQVREYCQDKGYTINPETFIDYYTSNGWHVGKNKMRDWRAAVRTWVNKDKDRKPKSKRLPFDQFLNDEEVSFE